MERGEEEEGQRVLQGHLLAENKSGACLPGSRHSTRPCHFLDGVSEKFTRGLLRVMFMPVSAPQGRDDASEMQLRFFCTPSGPVWLWESPK